MATSMMVPETLGGVRDALIEHAGSNEAKFEDVDEHVNRIWRSVSELQQKLKEKGTNMADMDSGTAALMAMAQKSGNSGGDGGMFGGGGMIGGLILGSLLRNNGNLLGGGDGAGAGALGATLRNPPEQNQANMDLMAAIGGVDKSVALSTATMEASQATQSLGIIGAINGVTAPLQGRIDAVKDVVNAGTMVLAQQLNGVQQQVMQNRYELSKDITMDGALTRSLIVSQYEATLNRQLSDANSAVIALQARFDGAERSRGIEVTTTNNINQMQSQQQQQQQYGQLANMIWGLGQSIRSTNEAINVGSGTLTANPANTNTNIR